MEKDINVGPETVVKMSIVSGQVKLEIDYAGKQATVGMVASMDVDQYLELLKAAIPGTLSAEIISALEAALKFVP